MISIYLVDFSLVRANEFISVVKTVLFLLQT